MKLRFCDTPLAKDRVHREQQLDKHNRHQAKQLIDYLTQLMVRQVGLMQRTTSQSNL